MGESRYTFTVNTIGLLPAPAVLSSQFRPANDIVITIQSTDTEQRTSGTPIARVVVPHAEGAPNKMPALTPIWVHGAHYRPVSSIHPAPGSSGVYVLYDTAGVRLADISYRSGRVIPWPRRMCWTVQLPGSTRPIIGKVGTWYGWAIYLGTAPVWFLFALCTMLYDLFAGSASDWIISHPARVRWRMPGSGTVLEYRKVQSTYLLDPRRLDPRIGHAIALLHAWERGERALRNAYSSSTRYRWT